MSEALHKAAQAALEALEHHVEQTRPIQKTRDAIVALRAALAQPPAPTAQPAAMLALAIQALEQIHKLTGGFTWEYRKIALSALAQIERAAAPQSAQQFTDDLGWLIEMKFGDGLLYWSGEFDPAGDDVQHARLIARMVKDAGHAVRFARREDGQRVLDAMLSARPCPVMPNARELYSVQEHLWPAAMSQPAQQPTAWRCACGANLYIDADGAPKSKAAPAERQPLSDNQLDTIALNHWADIRKDAIAAHKAFSNPLDAHRAFARAIEAAHNITAAPAAQKGEKL